MSDCHGCQWWSQRGWIGGFMDGRYSVLCSATADNTGKWLTLWPGGVDVLEEGTTTYY